MKNWFARIWHGLKTTLIGLSITVPYLFRKPYTLQYPEEVPDIPETERGLHNFEIDKCIACYQCAKICPVDCIAIEDEIKGKNAVLLKFEIDYTKCLFCALCCEPCPTECILMGPTFDLVGYTRDEVIIDYADRENPRTWSAGEQIPYPIASFARK
ncbi:MAG: NADH-quinone oxidoreductase subunit I [Planctomycetota bacterium]|nr:NADH-quinone oxidoreductase subunit I [Planctomycetota bacterium]